MTNHVRKRHQESILLFLQPQSLSLPEAILSDRLKSPDLICYLLFNNKSASPLPHSLVLWTSRSHMRLLTSGYTASPAPHCSGSAYYSPSPWAPQRQPKIRRGLVASMVLSYPREKADSQPDPEGPLYETMQEMQGTEPVERVFYKFPRV